MRNEQEMQQTLGPCIGIVAAVFWGSGLKESFDVEEGFG